MSADNCDPVIKIADFGFSTYLDPKKKGLIDFVGTEGYMAPEILKLFSNHSSLDEKYKSRSQDYNHKVDVWAVGIVAFEMLSGGSLPFAHRNAGYCHYNVIHKLPPYAKYEAFQDEVVRDFIKKCLIADPEQRPEAVAMLNHAWLEEF